MPQSPSSKKRKLSPSADNGTASKKAKKALLATTTTTITIAPTTTTPRETILALEEAIVESPKHYNNIVTLLAHLRGSLDAAADPQLAVTTAVALCRTFCRLMAKGRLLLRKAPLGHSGGGGDDEWAVAAWLRERYSDYTALLCQALAHDNGGVQNTALTLLMRLVKDEAALLRPAGHTCYFFPNESFAAIVRAIVAVPSSGGLTDEARREWVGGYVDVFDDVRYSFFTAIR